MDNDTLKNEFLIESFDNLSSINEDLTMLENNPNDKERLNKIYRTVHIMKGSAGFLGYKKLQEITHSTENLLDALREDYLKLTPEMTVTLLQSFNISSAIIKSVEMTSDEGNIDMTSITKKLNSYLIDEDKHSQDVEHESFEANIKASKAEDDLNIINEVEVQTEFSSTATLMQPIGSLLTKFERLVCDLSSTSGKKIILKISGQETVLENMLIKALKDPLIHIIRNACDHGLETPEDRVLSGKSSTGTIIIKAKKENGQLVIKIIDDGRGMDLSKIAAKALEKGIITQDILEGMDAMQIYGLIFTPGFSTAEKVTNISGRGVGMDVVKTNIEKIGGSVSINSHFGIGTTFTLSIPKIKILS